MSNDIIPYSKQNINSEDIKQVTDVLKSNFLTQGPCVPLFESKINKFVGAKYSVAVNSATSALHIACLSLGLKKNDIFWTVPNSFVASANAGLYCGAKVDFVDIDIETGNISLEELEKKLLISKKQKKLPKILICVHFAGQPYEQKKIFYLSKKYGFKIIEDASHAIGASHYNNKVGNCKWSDITVFSFHPVKIITTCEGGISITNNKNLYNKMIMYRTHGITTKKNKFKFTNQNPWYYEQQLLGFNYRMNDLQAALGISQIKRVKKFVEMRNNLALNYNKLLSNLPIITPLVKNYNYSSFHLYVVKIISNKPNILQGKIIKKFHSHNIKLNIHYFPIHLHPFYRQLGFKLNMFRNSEKHASTALSLPLFPGLKIAQQKLVAKILNDVFLNNSRK